MARHVHDWKPVWSVWRRGLQQLYVCRSCGESGYEVES